MHFSKISNTGTRICFKGQIHRLFTRVLLQCRLFKRQFKYKNHKITVPPIFLDNYDFFLSNSHVDENGVQRKADWPVKSRFTVLYYQS